MSFKFTQMFETRLSVIYWSGIFITSTLSNVITHFNQVNIWLGTKATLYNIMT